MYIDIIVYTEMASVRVQFASLGTGHYFWRWVVPKKNVFRGKNVSDPTIKKSKKCFSQPQISIKK